jgi:hypothetical protein
MCAGVGGNEACRPEEMIIRNYEWRSREGNRSYSDKDTLYV